MIRAALVAAVLAMVVTGADAACPNGRAPNVTVNDRFPLSRLQEAWRKAGMPRSGQLVSAITYLGAPRKCFGDDRCIIWLASDRTAAQRAKDLEWEMANACGRADPHRVLMDHPNWLPDPQWRPVR